MPRRSNALYGGEDRASEGKNHARANAANQVEAITLGKLQQLLGSLFLCGLCHHRQDG